MNERFDDVRAFGADDAEQQPEALSRMRNRVLSALPTVVPRRRVRTIGLSVSAAGLVAAAVVTAVVLTRTPVLEEPRAMTSTSPSAEASPVETPAETHPATPLPTTTPAPAPAPPTVQSVLAAAAKSTRTDRDIPDGAYRKVTYSNVSTVWLGYMGESVSDMIAPNDREAAYEWILTRTYYIPADRSEPWVQEIPTAPVLGQTWGDVSLLPPMSSDTSYPSVWALDVPWHHNDVIPMISDPTYPRDPQQLSDRLYADYGMDAGRYLLRALELNAADPEFHSAMLRAAALIPGGRIVSSTPRESTIAWDVEGEILFQITVDMTTGWVIASDWNFSSNGELGVPLDRPEHHSDVSMEIVWEAPALTR